MKHIVICGPAACGKTRNKHKLAKAFGCRNISDGASLHEIKVSVERATVKTLYLTNEITSGADMIGRRAEVLDFHDAMRRAGLDSRGA